MPQGQSHRGAIRYLDRVEVEIVACVRLQACSALSQPFHGLVELLLVDDDNGGFLGVIHGGGHVQAQPLVKVVEQGTANGQRQLPVRRACTDREPTLAAPANLESVLPNRPRHSRRLPMQPRPPKGSDGCRGIDS